MVGYSVDSVVEVNGTTGVILKEKEGGYLVALVSGGTGVFSASELSSGSFDEGDVDVKEAAQSAELSSTYEVIGDPYNPAVFREEAGFDELEDPEVGFTSLPNGWTRETLLKVWVAEFGASFSGCRREMAGNIASPSRFCAAFKDEVFQTEEWR